MSGEKSGDINAARKAIEDDIHARETAAANALNAAIAQIQREFNVVVMAVPTIQGDGRIGAFIQIQTR